MREPVGEGSPTARSETKTKSAFIIALKRERPELTALQIANHLRTSQGYVYNILSKHRRHLVSSERGRSDRLNGLNGLVSAHGLCFYEDQVLPGWVEGLRAGVVNARTGMKQVGFSAAGDPVSAQFHRNGRVILFPRAMGWRDWLIDELSSRGWDRERAALLVQGLRFTVKVAEAGVKTSAGFLPKDLLLKTCWGFMLVKDDSPSKNTLEIRLSVPDLERYLGLPEIRKELEVLTQGTMTMQQALRALVFLVKRQLEIAETLRGPGVPSKADG